MKKFICMFLAIVMVVSLVACGKTEPVATAPTVDTVIDTPNTEPVATEDAETETTPPDVGDEATEPTIERVPPTDFEAVDPATLPDPIPVEEQLKSDDTQTVTFDTLAEYEDFLWDLGFGEVRLEGSHEGYTFGERAEYGYQMEPMQAHCEPVSLTYNNNAFRFDFTYCVTTTSNVTTKEDGWHMYGTKSQVMDNVSAITDKEYIRDANRPNTVITIQGGQTVEDVYEGMQNATNVQDFLNSMGATNQETKIITPNYEEEVISFAPVGDVTVYHYLKAVYYPITGNLYNYMRNVDSEGVEHGDMLIDPNYNPVANRDTTMIGWFAQNMCFHYLFPEE